MSAANHEALLMADVEQLLGVTDRQVRTWIKDKGMPCHKDGRATTFVWREVLDWYVEYKASLSRYAGESRASKDSPKSDDPIYRKDAAVATLKEMDVEKAQGQLVRLEEIQTVFFAVVKTMQTEIRGLPSRIINQVLAIRDRDEMFTYLTDETNNTLVHLTQLRFDGTSTPAEAEDE